MTIVNLAAFSGITDNSPATPSYLNSKFSQLVSMITGVNESSFTDNILYAHTFSGPDAASKVSAALAALTAPGTIDCRSLVGAQDWGSVLTVNKSVALLFGASTFSVADRFLSVVSDDVRLLGGGIGITNLRKRDVWTSAQNQHIMIESSAVSRLEVTGFDIESTITGTLAKTATNYGIFVHDDDAHTKGTTGFWIHHNRVRVTGSEPSVSNRHLGIFAWTTDTAPPQLTGDGAIQHNLLDACAGRNIEVALAQNVDISGNLLTSVGSEMTIVGVGIRMIGSKTINVVGNTVIINHSALSNSDGIQVNGDNRSNDINITGNLIRTSAGDGTGIKLSNCSDVLVSGNHLTYDGVGTGVNGILMECQSSHSTRAASGVHVVGNYVHGFTDAQITIAATPPVPQDITIAFNRLGRPAGSASEAKYFNISSTDPYADRIRIFGNSCGTQLGGVFASNVTTPAGAVHSLVGVGTGLLPSIVSHQVALIGEITSTLSVGGQAGYAVVGVASTSDSTTSDRVYGGFFKASANIGEVEVGLRAESADTNGVAFQWGTSKSTTKGQIDGAGTIRAFNGSGSAATLGYAFLSEASLGFYRSAASTINQSYGTFNLASNSVRLSVRTVAAASLDSTTLAVNEMAFSVAGASGASLAIRSGSTIWYFSSSLSTKA